MVTSNNYRIWPPGNSKTSRGRRLKKHYQKMLALLGNSGREVSDYEEEMLKRLSSISLMIEDCERELNEDGDFCPDEYVKSS